MKVEYEIAKGTVMEEQETVVNRVRSEGNLLRIYTSDTRIINKVFKQAPQSISKTYFTQDKKVVAIECTIEIQKFLKGIWWVLYKGT